MPKLGMRPVQRRQLIDVTLDAVNEVRMYDAIIARIARRADISTGTIDHYFRDKNGLPEAAMHDITSQLRDAVFSHLHVLLDSGTGQHLQVAIGSNFGETQVSSTTMEAWLAFWASSVHQSMLYRLQWVSSRRLLSNLMYEFHRGLPCEQAQEADYGLTASINGLWLWTTLNGRPLDEALAQSLTSHFIRQHLPNP